MRRQMAALAVAVLLVTGLAGVAVAAAPARLVATGPTAVTGTDATAVFSIGDRTVRQVRYQDRGVLDYRFMLRNDGALPVTVTGLAALTREPRLLHHRSIVDGAGRDRFEVPAGEAVAVVLRMRMHGCETLSARAGSFASAVALDVARAGLWHDTVMLRLPEEVHTGSPREAFCPRATATSRPPG